MFDFILKPLGMILSFVYNFTGSYIITLLIFAILMKIVLFPLAIKQQKNSMKQAALRPREMAIRKKYAGRNDKATQTKMNEEVMKLYQEENFNPASGCLPLLVQLPILMALYSVIINPLTYILNFSSDQLTKLREAVGPVLSTFVVKFDATRATQNDLIRLITEHKDDLSEAFKGLNGISFDSIFKFYSQFDFFGVNLLKMPSISKASILLAIPVITFIAAFISGKVVKKLSYQPTNVENAGASMALMDWTMPLMSVYISFIVPSLIGIYWIFQNLLTMLQQYILYRLYPIPKITDEQIKEAELQLKGKAPRNTESNVAKETSTPAIAKAPIKGKKKNRLSLIQRKKGVNIEFKKRIKKSGIKPKAIKKPKNNIA